MKNHENKIDVVKALLRKEYCDLCSYYGHKLNMCIKDASDSIPSIPPKITRSKYDYCDQFSKRPYNHLTSDEIDELLTAVNSSK
jgi:hypothetical protein